jgi:Mrp family chromosome partitioning ATPase
VNTFREGQPKAVVFSGIARGVGTTAAVFGVAEQLIVRHGLRTLVVELNRVRPESVSKLSLDSDRTIAAYAAGKIAAGQCIQKNSSGVLFVPAPGEDPAVTSHAAKLLSEVKSDFDMILIDAPPDSGADGLVIAGLVREMVLVVECGRTRFEAIERARRDMANQNVVILGAILNKRRYLIPGWIYRRLIEGR